jgi:hypothetical protein
MLYLSFQFNKYCMKSLIFVYFRLHKCLELVYGIYLLTVIGEQYFQALKLISAVRAMPGFSHLPAESLGLDNPISQPPPLLYK